MLEGMGREQMRAADADRQQIAEQLRAALEEGRLDLSEYDERLQEAYTAKTYADLDRLLADLPGASQVVLPAQPAVPVAPPADRATAAWLRETWGSWGNTLGILTTIWLITSIASSELAYYWPVWVVGPWGVVLAYQTVSGLAKGEPRRFVADQEHRRQLREHRRERKALYGRAIANGELPAKPSKEQRKAFIAQATANGDLPPKPRKPV